MRLFLLTTLCATALFGQGGGNVQFRDWTKPPTTGKPAMACSELRSLTTSTCR